MNKLHHNKQIAVTLKTKFNKDDVGRFKNMVLYTSAEVVNFIENNI